MARAKGPKLTLPPLDSGPVPLSGIRDQARRQLLDLIDARRGKKALILDPSISGPISLLDSNMTELLTEHGVAKLLYLEPKRLDDPSYNAAEPRLADIRSVVYIARATVENTQMLAGQIKARPPGQQHDFAVFFVPRRTIACDRVLEEEGVAGDVAVGELSLELLPLEEDVISLELEQCFRECVVEGDSTALFYTARALMRLQAMFGLIPRIQGKGPAAAAVRDMCIRMRKESPAVAGSVAVAGLPGGAAGSRIDRCILLDREVDLVTPMMTQITFEGLVDEVTGIKHGAVPWTPKDPKSAGLALGSGRGVTLLNSTDPFFREFRDLPFHVAVMRLQQSAREARAAYSELGSKDLSELKTFVKGLPQLMMLDRLSDVATPVAEQVKQPLFHERLKAEQDLLEHYNTEGVANFVEELMCRGAELSEVLRLLLLMSACHQGVPRRHLDRLRQEVLHTYGHEHLITLNALEKSGLLRASTSSGKPPFASIRKGLRLVVPEEQQTTTATATATSTTATAPSGGPGGPPVEGGGPEWGLPGQPQPCDVSWLYKGYAPLSIRLVETALRSGWGPITELLLQLPGPHFDILQTVDNQGLPTEKPYSRAAQQAALAAANASSSMGASTSASTADGAAANGASAPGASASAAGQPSSSASPSSASPAVETVLVVFIGGVTYAEISALRFLSSRPEWPYRFIVLTTKIVNGRTLLQSFMEPSVAKLGSLTAALQQ